ncbi:MAG: hypothetical protein HYV09_11025 [Deltaproteobacteria bacterium]|nr:hypothetical protein [Deltaproteobacteria bacterium]
MISKRLACVVFTSTLVVSGLMIGCTQEAEEEGGIGSEEAALKDPATGEPTCSGKKVLICHIPPGNPANAHEICVGEPAVAAHVKNHGDPIGPCPPPSAPPATDSGPPSPPEGDSGAPQGDDVILR